MIDRNRGQSVIDGLVEVAVLGSYDGKVNVRIRAAHGRVG